MLCKHILTHCLMCKYSKSMRPKMSENLSWIIVALCKHMWHFPFLVDYDLRCVQKVENVWIYTSVHKAFITLFTFTRGKGLPFFMLDTFNVFAFNIFVFFFAFFGPFLYSASIHYLQAQNYCFCSCCGRISNYNCRIKFMALPISLPPTSLYDKTFLNNLKCLIVLIWRCWLL